MDHLLFHFNILHSTPQISSGQVSSNVPQANTTQLPPENQSQTDTPPRQPPHQTLPKTPAFTSHTQNPETVLTINTLHTKTLNYL